MAYLRYLEKGEFEFTADTKQAVMKSNYGRPFYETVELAGNKDGFNVYTYTGKYAESPSDAKFFTDRFKAVDYFNKKATISDRISQAKLRWAMEKAGLEVELNGTSKSAKPEEASENKANVSSTRGIGGTSTSRT